MQPPFKLRKQVHLRKPRHSRTRRPRSERAVDAAPPLPEVKRVIYPGSSQPQATSLQNGSNLVPHVSSYGPYGYTAFIPYGFQVDPVNGPSQFVAQHESPGFINSQTPVFTRNNEAVTIQLAAVPSTESSTSDSKTQRESNRPTSSEGISPISNNGGSTTTRSFSVSLSSGGDPCSQLCAAVGMAAAAVNQDVGQEINVNSIDWNAIANSFSNMSAAECQQQWRTEYPDHRFARMPHGVVMYSNEAADDLLRQSSSGTSEPLSNAQTGSGSGSGSQCGTNNMKKDSSGDQSTSIEGSSNGEKKRRRKVWTDEEVSRIDEMQQELGNRWKLIAERLGTGRTATEVKNYWHNRQQKVALKLLRKGK